MPSTKWNNTTGTSPTIARNCFSGNSCPSFNRSTFLNFPLFFSKCFSWILHKCKNFRVTIQHNETWVLNQKIPGFRKLPKTQVLRLGRYPGEHTTPWHLALIHKKCGKSNQQNIAVWKPLVPVWIPWWHPPRLPCTSNAAALQTSANKTIPGVATLDTRQLVLRKIARGSYDVMQKQRFFTEIF